jgi:hypothetical protein
MSPLPERSPISPDPDKSIFSGDILKMTNKERNMEKGRNVSGRTWKVRPQKRASFLVKTKVNNQVSTYEARQVMKRLKKEAVELQTELREERRQSKITKRSRREENEKRRMENEFKQANSAAQTLNSGKVGVTLKALSKKQLRQIKKSRMNTKTGVVEYVSAYAK